MSQDEDLNARRRTLKDRLDAHEVEAAKDAQAKGSPSAMAGYAIAFRLSTEFISAIVVGGLLGFALDYVLGTKPWLLIVFILLGFVAGILNVLRSAGLIQTPQVGKRPPKRGDEPSNP